MKNLKKMSILITSLAVIFSPYLKGIVPNNVKQQRRATGDTHSLIFKGDYRERNYAESSAGWWGDVPTFENETATLTQGTFYFTNATAVTEGEKYIISYDLKTEGDVYFSLEIVLPEWSSLQSNKLVNHADYVHYNFIYTAPKSNTQVIPYFKITDGTSMSIKNLYIYNTTSLSVTEGQVIESLPNIEAKDGKRGYWAIDGKEIKVGDTYNYSTDKVVDLVYEDVYSVTYHNGGAINLASDTKYWNSGTNLTKEDDALHMKNEDGLADKPIHTYDVSDPLITTVETGKKYKLSFDIKCDNVFLRVANCNPWVMLVEGFKNYQEFTTIESEFEVSVTGVTQIRFRIDTTGDVYIKNLHLYEITTIEYTKNQALGELPSINGLGKYDSASWQIDGKDITSESIFNYDVSSKNAYVKYDFYNSAKFIKEWKELRAVGGSDGICYILKNDNAKLQFENLMQKYNSLSSDERSIINQTIDSGDATILDTMQYISGLLTNVENSDSNHSLEFVNIFQENSNTNISIIIVFITLSLTVVGYFVYSKKKHSF